MVGELEDDGGTSETMEVRLETMEARLETMETLRDNGDTWR